MVPLNRRIGYTDVCATFKGSSNDSKIVQMISYGYSLQQFNNFIVDFRKPDIARKANLHLQGCFLSWTFEVDRKTRHPFACQKKPMYLHAN